MQAPNIMMNTMKKKEYDEKMNMVKIKIVIFEIID